MQSIMRKRFHYSFITRFNYFRSQLLRSEKLVFAPTSPFKINAITKIQRNFVYQTNHNRQYIHGHYQQNSDSLFVSQHFKIVNEDEILEFIQRNDFKCKSVHNEIIIKECPFCHDHKNKIDNMWKLYINKLTGAYHCHRCGAKGSWYDFKLRISLGKQPIIKMVNPQTFQNKKRFPTNEDINMYQESFKNGQYPQVYRYLSERGLSYETALRFRLGVGTFDFMNDEGKWEKHTCITFPMFVPHKDTVRIVRHKIRSLSQKRFQRVDIVGGMWGFFGWNLVPEDAKEIIITEGEFDAMAVYQATRRPAISVPNGCRSLPIELLPYLEKFEKIYLWMDDDVPGQEGAESFARKLGLGRCYIVHAREDGDTMKIKDANDALLARKDLSLLLERAAPLQHNQICTFSQLKHEIKNELYGDSKEITGERSIFFPSYNKIFKGFRRGELTIFTGPTGSGKTTILSQLSLDFCMQGVTTLWGSFEIKNSRLIKKMLCQMSGKNLSQYPHEFEKYSEQFEQYPMYFMNFFGSTNVDDVLDAMDYAVYVYDVRHVIIDNLQFMLSGQSYGYDKFDAQDRAIEKFRQFATNKNIHITIVIHPRKVEDDSKLGIHSVFGTAKATQEADNIIIIQKGSKYRYMAVKKNRYDGTLGEIPYRYDRENSRIYELTEDELHDVENDIIKLEY